MCGTGSERTVATRFRGRQFDFCSGNSCITRQIVELTCVWCLVHFACAVDEISTKRESWICAA